ncbi:MAG: ferrous iron transport protein A [Chitinophagaceae bacterium]|nr:MAG: ferrous iron transport protein A [Chitinophagaceae bacterium]
MKIFATSIRLILLQSSLSWVPCSNHIWEKNLLSYVYLDCGSTDGQTFSDLPFCHINQEASSTFFCCSFFIGCSSPVTAVTRTRSLNRSRTSFASIPTARGRECLRFACARDRTGKYFLWRNSQSLTEAPIKTKSTIRALGNTSDEFLGYLDWIAITIGSKVEVLEVEPFDGSLTILHEKKRLALSKEVAVNLLTGT